MLKHPVGDIADLYIKHILKPSSYGWAEDDDGFAIKTSVTYSTLGLMENHAGYIEAVVYFNQTKLSGIKISKCAEKTTNNTWSGSNNFTGGLQNNGVEVATLEDIAGYRHEVVATVTLTDSNGQTIVNLMFNRYNKKSTALGKNDIFNKSARTDMEAGGYVDILGENAGVYPIISVDYDLQYGFEVIYLKNNTKVRLNIFSVLNNMSYSDTITEV